MKPLADEIEAKRETENLAINSNVPRDHLFKTNGPNNSLGFAYRTKRRNDLHEWRNNIALLRERTEFSDAT